MFSTANVCVHCRAEVLVRVIERKVVQCLQVSPSSGGSKMGSAHEARGQSSSGSNAIISCREFIGIGRPWWERDGRASPVSLSLQSRRLPSSSRTLNDLPSSSSSQPFLGFAVSVSLVAYVSQDIRDCASNTCTALSGPGTIRRRRRCSTDVAHPS